MIQFARLEGLAPLRHSFSAHCRATRPSMAALAVSGRNHLGDSARPRSRHGWFLENVRRFEASRNAPERWIERGALVRGWIRNNGCLGHKAMQFAVLFGRVAAKSKLVTCRVAPVALINRTVGYPPDMEPVIGGGQESVDPKDHLRQS